MKVAIVGAGIVGVATAYELAADGHAVTVYERRGAVAEESSFATAGLVSPAWLAPWAGAGTPAGLLRRLFGRRGGLRLAGAAGFAQLRWLTAWSGALSPEARRAHLARAQRLAIYSRERMHALSHDLHLHYECSPGLLVLLRSDRDAQRVRADLPLLQEAGLRFQELTADEARAIEPGLAPAQPLAGALHLPDDGVANCREFAVLLRRHAQALGARFAFKADVLPLDRAGPTRLRLRAADGGVHEEAFDHVVVCAGASAPALLGRSGPRLPILPVWGYSVTAPIEADLHAPRSAVVDARHQVSISRLGQRVRVAGGFEIGGTAAGLHAPTLASLYRVLQDWFPGGARLSGRCTTVQEWKGAHPMRPEGTPLIGPSGLPGVWLNVGHGASGWALACGSGRALADLVAARSPEVDLEGLQLPHPAHAAR